MFRCVFIGLTAVSLLMACPVLDRVCGIDALAMQTRLSDLNVHYEAIYMGQACVGQACQILPVTHRRLARIR